MIPPFSFSCKHQDLINRLRTRASIRRSITDRKSFQEGRPDRIAAVLDEAADAIQELLDEKEASFCQKIKRLFYW